MATERSKAVEKELSSALEKGYKSAKINTRTEAGPLDLLVVTAAVQGGYPGSGVLRVLLDQDGVTYGIHGQKDFADLVRAKGWLATPPDVQTLVRLADIAFFEGVAILLDKPAASVTATPAWKLTLYRTWHPSGGITRVEITVPKTGKAEVVSTSLPR